MDYIVISGFYLYLVTSGKGYCYYI